MICFVSIFINNHIDDSVLWIKYIQVTLKFLKTGPRQPQKEVHNLERADKRVFLPSSENIEKPYIHPKLPKIASAMPKFTEAPAMASQDINNSKIHDDVTKGARHPLFPDPRSSKTRDGDFDKDIDIHCGRLIDDVLDEKIQTVSVSLKFIEFMCPLPFKHNF